MAWDILIGGGMVIDGSGRPGERADVAIAGGRIAAIGPGLTGEAARVTDAEGLAVRPAVIERDAHRRVARDRAAPGRGWHGGIIRPARRVCDSDNMPASIARSTGDNLFELVRRIRFSAAAAAG